MEFEAQLAPIYPEVVRYARALAGSEADGDDLLQDALVRALRGYARLRKAESFRYWLFHIIANVQRSRMRRRRIIQWLSLDHAQRLPAPSGVGLEERETLRRALGQVGQEQREALILFEILGWSVAEIARFQRVSASAVKSRLARGRERLRAQYRRLSQ